MICHQGISYYALKVLLLLAVVGASDR